MQHACRRHPDSEHGSQAEAELRMVPAQLSDNKVPSCLYLENANGTKASTTKGSWLCGNPQGHEPTGTRLCSKSRVCVSWSTVTSCGS